MAQAPVFAASVGLNAVQGAAQTFASVEAQKAQAAFQRQQLDINRRFSEMQAEDALARGERDVQAARRKTAGLIGSQRAALAAQGVDIGRGDAADIQLETAELGAMDELTIRNNAYREAFGFRTQALQFGSQGAFAGIAARAGISQTILTGGAQFASGTLDAASRFGLFRSGDTGSGNIRTGTRTGGLSLPEFQHNRLRRPF